MSEWVGVWVWVCVCVCARVRVHMRTCACLCACVHACIYVYACMCVCMHGPFCVIMCITHKQNSHKILLNIHTNSTHSLINHDMEFLPWLATICCHYTVQRKSIHPQNNFRQAAPDTRYSFTQHEYHTTRELKTI